MLESLEHPLYLVSGLHLGLDESMPSTFMTLLFLFSFLSFPFLSFSLLVFVYLTKYIHLKDPPLSGSFNICLSQFDLFHLA